MEMQQAKAIIESLLFVSDHPITIREISKVLDGVLDRRSIESLLDELTAEYVDRALQIVAVADGYQFCTRPEYGDCVRRFVQQDSRSKLSRSAIETLAIVAYKQPITKAETEFIRGGVDAGGVLRTLLERRLIRILGRKQVPGRPIMYGTSPEFLVNFGLRDLTELPTLKEFIDQGAELDIPESQTTGESEGDTAEEADAESMPVEEVESPVASPHGEAQAGDSRSTPQGGNERDTLD